MIGSKVYIVHTLDNDMDVLDKEYDDDIQKWLSYCPINKIQEILGTQQSIEKYVCHELEKLGYKITKDKEE